ncbi:hypothetical protein COLO4_28717 [Corchorus olitorius]|uniref:Sulfotransferase n=1 Tax=Corchorus olitorius TaxID=93759 RepID=A0A1R3HIN3_9ROSI|nr:hypothetical protein COLO4_28717 [Corchorus olitorius]
MEPSSMSKPIIASKTTVEWREKKYKDEISNLTQKNGWSPSQPLCLYKDFWFYPFFLQGALYARDHFQAQPNDVFICSSMKTGCTWIKSLCFSIATRSQFDDSTSPLRTTVPHDCIPFLEFGEYFTAQGPKIPLFASHLPYTCLPESVIDLGCKIIYLCRDPKDTYVSMWHFFRKVVATTTPGDEDSFVSNEEGFELFCKGLSSYGPYWDHVLGYWKASLERPDKILFFKYEDLKKETEACVRKLAEFLECPFSIEEEREGTVQKIIKFCSFESLSNLEVNKTGKQVKGRGRFVENNKYFRKGKVGDWKNYLSAEMDELENDRVFVNQPWNFNKALLALNDYDGLEALESIPFEITPFWVRIYGLPLRMMNEKIGVAVGEAVGPVLEAESLNAHTSRSPGSEGSHQRGSFGGFISPNHGARAACSGIRGSGSQSVPSKSVTGGGAAFQNHVDSMVLRGKSVARALTYEDQLCEIISRIDGRVAVKTPRFQGDGSSDNRRRDARFEGCYG